MKRFFFLTCMILCSRSFADFSSLPETFRVTEKTFSWTTSFEIESDSQRIGCIYRKFFALTPEYHLEDASGKLISKSRQHFWTQLPTFDVTDDKGEPIGVVEKENTWFYPTYRIVTKEHRIAAELTMNFWGTTFTMIDPADKHEIAVMTRPYFAFKSYWTVNIKDKAALSADKIHPNMFLMVLAFQVDHEYWEKAKQREAAREREERRKQRERYGNDYYHRYHDYSQDPYYRDPFTRSLKLPLSHKQNYLKKLSPYKKKLQKIRPRKKDFAMIEKLPQKLGLEKTLTKENFYKGVNLLIKKLNSAKLSKREKKALLILLEERIKKSPE